MEAAKKLGFDEHQVFKTLMADTGSERVVGVVPVSGHMDLKALAAAVVRRRHRWPTRRSRCASPAMWSEASRRSGSARITKTVLDESALQFDEILLSGGKRGFSVGGQSA